MGFRDIQSCDEISFCRRQRNVRSGEHRYEVKVPSLKLEPNLLSVELEEATSKDRLLLEVSGLSHGVIQVKINEAAPLRTRYQIPKGEIVQTDAKSLSIELQQEESSTITVELLGHRVVLHVSPFKLEILGIGVSVNSNQLLKFECYKEKKTRPRDQRWYSSLLRCCPCLKSMHGSAVEREDSEPFGPSSIGVDVQFDGYAHAYGLPEHAVQLALMSTFRGANVKLSEPYRLYNRDKYAYPVHSTNSIYGSAPVMFAHSPERTVGMFWHNASETMIDIDSSWDKQDMDSENESQKTSTHWFSETGVIDIFILIGPQPQDVSRQYGLLTGTTALPPLFALGYHQCRWNYNDEEDVRSVDAGLEKCGIPYDVIWLDIEHTDGKRYFTWDKSKFPQPKQMISDLAARGHKTVLIVDPHIKVDEGYSVYTEGKQRGLFVKDKDGKDYVGNCWPGSSCWLDYTNPAVRDFWASKFSLDSYQDTTLDVHIWNDMNEPAIFGGPDNSMWKDAIHHDGWEHRNLHNLYGYYLHKSTHQGMLQRSGNRQRPFILSRSFFAGSQKYGAVWTGDNVASWEHLRMTIPMLLSLSVCGITLVGADVGGFHEEPTPELLTRWYQAAAYQPFFREHSTRKSRRREPYLFPEQAPIIRQAVLARYALLPYWYTTFYQSEKTGSPVMKPLWMEFPKDWNTFTTDNEYLIGSSLLVHPVTQSHCTEVEVYFPGPAEIWYDVDTHKVMKEGYHKVKVTEEKIPVFQRGGSVIARKDTKRLSSAQMHDDPYNLTVCLDSKEKARGYLFIDDYHTFDYRDKKYIERHFEYADGSFRSWQSGGQNFTSKAAVQKIIIVGLSWKPQKVELVSGAKGSEKNINFTYQDELCLLTIAEVNVNIGEDWSIHFK